ncbi:MAG TPA: hypothetical protein VNL77_08435 [Roseiflexaceae bacterium]|nr:hypothetical protein [Roseiflexaceae bacterium]
MSRYDLEEIAPNRFLIHDPRARMIVKGEGVVEGNRFMLTGRRRAGLLARLRERGFRVLALEDRIAALPRLPAPPPAAAPLWRPLASPAERLSAFDPAACRWQPLAPVLHDGRSGVWLRPGWPVRRRHGRGPADFFLAQVERSGAGLRPLDEERALLHGYALAAEAGTALHAVPHPEGLLIPAVDLPPRHRALLRTIAAETPEGLLADEAAWPFAQALFARLGVRLESPP